jgi:hypothetical protein
VGGGVELRAGGPEGGVVRSGRSSLRVHGRRLRRAAKVTRKVSSTMRLLIF